MAANTDPIFTITPRITWATIAGANTSADFTTTTNSALIFTGQSNGSLLREIRVKFAPGTNTAAAAMRIWLNNGSTTGTAANNILTGEITIPATTAATASAQVDVVYVFSAPGLFVPNAYVVYCAMGAYSTGTFHCMGIGGDF
jgi:hypothetical protein